MTELAIAYIKDTETKMVKEIKFMDSKYISIENMSFGLVMRRCFRYIRLYLFSKAKIPEKHLYEAIRSEADRIYIEHNEYLEKNDLPIINYQECFEEEDKNLTSYIM